MSQTLPKIIAVIGATASGKTELGSYLCQQIGGEIVSTDAKQVYRGMDIGTAKELDLPVKQHLLDIKNPGEKITVAWYQQEAYVAIDQLLAKKIVPVLVGGSGLYVDAVTEGYVFSEIEKSSEKQKRYSTLKIGIEIDREVLKKKVIARTKSWIDRGLLTEIKTLLEQGISPEWLYSCGHEYRYFTLYLQGELSLEEANRKTNTSINQFIKRQYTWWRRHADVHWVSDKEQALALVANFLD